MARPHRIDYPGARHHVMNRGARHEPIFPNDAACSLFIGILAELPDRFGVRVHAYALMPNHFHLLLEVPRGNLSRVMQHLCAEYVGRLNRLTTWDGPLLRGRFRNRVVEDDAYWRYLLLYLHLNPVEAHLVVDPADAIWTSHAAYAGLVRPPEWLTTADLLGQYGGAEGYLEALREVRIGRRGPPPGFDPEHLWATPRTKHTPEVEAALAHPVPTQILPDPATELNRIAHALDLPVEALRSARPGRGDNRPRWFTAWWLAVASGIPQRTVAGLLHANEEQVSRWVARMGAGTPDPLVASWIARLR
jgi:REP element-mobilizing transposase RayT